MLVENATIKKWIKHASCLDSYDLSFLGEDEFIKKCPAIYNDVTLNNKQKYKKNCEFERYWGLYYLVSYKVTNPIKKYMAIV